MDLILKNALVAGRRHEGALEIAVREGRIAAIGRGTGAEARETIDLGGKLVCAGLVESHIHLDKSRIIERCAPEQGRMAQTVKRVQQAKLGFTEADVYERARRTLEAAILQGTTRMRNHVEVDPPLGLAGLRAIQRLAKDYAWAIELEICVF